MNVESGKTAIVPEDEALTRAIGRIFRQGRSGNRRPADHPSRDSSMRRLRDCAPLLPEPTRSTQQARQILMPNVIPGHQGLRLFQPGRLLTEVLVMNGHQHHVAMGVCV